MYGRLPAAIDSLLDWGKVTASSISSRVKNLLGTVDGGDGDVAKDQVLGTHAAILARPAPPSDDGHFEVFFVRRGEERRPVASHDTRWQVDVAEGEVVVRAFGENASRIRLKPNGDVVIEAGGEILLGGPGASKKVALEESVDAEIERIWNTLTTWTVVSMDGGAALQARALVDAELVQPTGSSKVKASE